MSPPIIWHQTTKSILVEYSERELTFEVDLPTNLGGLTFKNTSKWVIDQIGVVAEVGDGVLARPGQLVRPFFDHLRASACQQDNALSSACQQYFTLSSACQQDNALSTEISVR